MKDEIIFGDNEGQLNNVLGSDNEVAYNENCDTAVATALEKSADQPTVTDGDSLDETRIAEQSEAENPTSLAKSKRKRNVLNAVCISLIIVLLAIAVFVNVFQLCLVVGSSMDPTLCDGEFLLMQKVGVEIKRGDIVTLNVKEEDKYPIIKRVVAIKGDRVVFMYDENDSVLLYIDKGNGFELQQDKYVKDGKMSYSVFGTFKQFSDGNFKISPKCDVDEIQPGCIIQVDGLFVLGDNRDNSYDSRQYGVIPYENVQSKVVKELKKGSFAEKILKILFNAD